MRSNSKDYNAVMLRPDQEAGSVINRFSPGTPMGQRWVLGKVFICVLTHCCLYHWLEVPLESNPNVQCVQHSSFLWASNLVWVWKKYYIKQLCSSKGSRLSCLCYSMLTAWLAVLQQWLCLLVGSWLMSLGVAVSRTHFALVLPGLLKEDVVVETAWLSGCFLTL